MKSENTCDIIIENVIKDWEKSMKNQNKREQWETPKYSKSQINKAGKIISDLSSTDEVRNNALTILNNWRAAHAYPLHVICNNLRLNNPNAIVVQRLKRLESITGKIERFPDMSLYRMQDLGGCRVIVNTIEQVYEAVDKYKNSRIRHILKKENDYIKEPKTSGYRSYHMVYQFNSDKKDTYNKNMLIEIQFRTKLQHIWATAVEMMGIYTKSNLKSSHGDEDILRFFALVSSVIAIKENMPLCPNTHNNIKDLLEEILSLDKKHHIINNLSGMQIAVDQTKNKDDKYYLLILNYDKRKISIRNFNSIEPATKSYGEIEKTSNINVVLVSANSFDTVRKAYPNYFADISEFINMLREIIKENKNI